MPGMHPDIAELHRLIQNLIRLGTIAQVARGRARVRLSPKLTTTWLRWVTPRAGDARTWWAPSVGEQVTVLSPGGNLAAGVIVPSIYSDAYPAPTDNSALHTTHYPDGAVVQYDHAAHALTANLPGGTATVTAVHVTIDAPDTTCTGNLHVAHNLVVDGMSSLNAGMAVLPGAEGGAAAHIMGTLEASDDVVSGPISLRGHAHEKVKRGEDTSGGPV